MEQIYILYRNVNLADEKLKRNGQFEKKESKNQDNVTCICIYVNINLYDTYVSHHFHNQSSFGHIIIYIRKST